MYNAVLFRVVRLPYRRSRRCLGNPWAGPINAALKRLKIAAQSLQVQPQPFSASSVSRRFSDAFSSSLTHATMNLQPPSHTVLYQNPGSSAAVLQSPVMPNTRRSSVTQLGLEVQQTCLRAVVQLPRVTAGAHPPVDLVRQSCGVSDAASQLEVKEVVWRFCCPVALKTICVAGARRIGVHMVSVLLPEMVRPNASKTLTKIAIIGSSRCGDRDAMHALQFLEHPPNSTQRTFQCRFRANLRRPFLKMGKI